jgi:hypothetical protein
VTKVKIGLGPQRWAQQMLTNCDYKGCTETHRRSFFMPDEGWSHHTYGKENFLVCPRHSYQFDTEWPEDDVHLNLEQFKEWLNGQEPTPLDDS